MLISAAGGPLWIAVLARSTFALVSNLQCSCTQSVHFHLGACEKDVGLLARVEGLKSI
jgi:hypothetical protein